MTSVPDAKVPCPKCGTSLAVPLAEIAPGAGKLCPNCGATIKFTGQDASKIQSIIEQLETQIPGARINVTVKTKNRRPWWKFWAES
jgi:hypothetical protein